MFSSAIRFSSLRRLISCEDSRGPVGWAGRAGRATFGAVPDEVACVCAHARRRTVERVERKLHECFGGQFFLHEGGLNRHARVRMEEEAGSKDVGTGENVSERVRHIRPVWWPRDLTGRGARSSRA